jgi:drug/metabolite transporter (DMT)-like permease
MQPIKGIFFKLASVTLFIVMSSLIKAVSENVPPGEAVFFRAFFAIPVIFVWLWLRGDQRTGLRVQSPLAHFWRGFVGTCAMGLMFAGLGLLPLPEVTAIGYAAPLLTVVFAAMFLGEEVRAFRLAAVALGMAGVLIVLSPRLTVFSGEEVARAEALGAMLVLMGAVCAALAQIYVRKLVQTEQTSAIVFYFSLTSTVLALMTLPFGWVVPTQSEAALLILAGLLGGTGQIFLTTAYRYADASVVAPFDYASMLLAILIGYFVFDEVPTVQMLIGAGLVIVATNGYSSEDVPEWMAGRTMPVASNVLVTRPLTGAEVQAAGWTSAQMAYDTRQLLHYFRLMPDNRFLFGRRGGLTSSPGADRAAIRTTRRHFETMFPAWGHVESPHNWSGMVCLSAGLVPYCGQVPGMQNCFAGFAYHGNGVAMGSYTGALLADLALGRKPENRYPTVM